MSFRILYEQSNYPIFQNRMYDTAVAANAATRGQIQIIEDLSTGLCYNRIEYPGLTASLAIASYVRRSLDRNTLKN